MTTDTKQLLPLKAKAILALKYLIAGREVDIVAKNVHLTPDELKGLVREYGWPNRDEMRKSLDELNAEDASQPKPAAAVELEPITIPVELGDVQVLAGDAHLSIEALLDRIKGVDNKALLTRAETAIAKLTTVLEDLNETESAKAAREAQEREQAEALAEVERLANELAEARKKAGLGPKTADPRTKRIREWAVEAGLLKTGSRGRVPGEVVEKYDAAHAS